MLYKRCLNLSGEYMNPIKPDTLQSCNQPGSDILMMVSS